MERRIFYTYAWLREDGSPYYIGKGHGDRAWSHKSRKKSPPSDLSRILILKDNLTEEEAFKHEIYMIYVYGRKDLGTGILWNFTDGGQGPTGLKHSVECRKRMSRSHTGKRRGPPSEATRKKMSETQKGRKLPEETCKKMSVAKKGKPWTEARRLAQSQRKNPTLET